MINDSLMRLINYIVRPDTLQSNCDEILQCYSVISLLMWKREGHIGRRPNDQVKAATSIDKGSKDNKRKKHYLKHGVSQLNTKVA